MIVFFKTAYNEMRNIGEVETEKEAFKTIVTFLEEHDYKAPYMRTHEVDNTIIVDVGSWSEFFHIKK